MASKTIMWGDGTSDRITIVFFGSVGISNLTVMSDPNPTLSQRKAIIRLKINGATVGTLTVEQQPRRKAFSVAYHEAYK